MKLIKVCDRCGAVLDWGQMIDNEEPTYSLDDIVYFRSLCCYAPVVEEWVEVSDE